MPAERCRACTSALRAEPPPAPRRRVHGAAPRTPIPGRGVQQKRFRQSAPCSGNVCTVRCDSASRHTPVMPPGAGNTCHTGSHTGRSLSSAIIRSKSVRSASRFAGATRGSHPLASTMCSRPSKLHRLGLCSAALRAELRRRGIGFPHEVQNFVSVDGVTGVLAALPTASATFPSPCRRRVRRQGRHRARLHLPRSEWTARPRTVYCCMLPIMFMPMRSSSRFWVSIRQGKALHGERVERARSPANDGASQ